MNGTSTKQNPLGKLRGALITVQNTISSSSYSYLFYAFIIPVALMYLIYLSMGIHPFGNGSVLVLDLNGQYVYFYESLRNAIHGDGSFLYTFSRALGGEYLSFGSDAHVASDLGANFDDAVELAKAAGFTHLTTFRNRQKIMEALK